MSTIKLTPEQRDKKAQAAYTATGHVLWSDQDTGVHNFWRKLAIAVLESDGDTVEIIEPEPEIPDEAIQVALGAYYTDSGRREDGVYAAMMRRALGAVVKSGLLPGREPK